MHSPRPSDAPGSELSVSDVLQRMVHECPACAHALELGAFRLQLALLIKMWDSYPAEVASPLVVSRLADAIHPACLSDLSSQFDLFQDADDLAFAEL